MGNKGERYEFGEAAGLGLDASEEVEVKDYIFPGFAVAEEEGGGGGKAGAVSVTDDGAPLGGGELPRGQPLTDPVIEDFGGGAGDGSKPGIA